MLFFSLKRDVILFPDMGKTAGFLQSWHQNPTEESNKQSEQQLVACVHFNAVFWVVFQPSTFLFPNAQEESSTVT